MTQKRVRVPARKRPQDRNHPDRERAAERGEVSASEAGMGATGTTGTATWRGPGTSEDAPSTFSAGGEHADPAPPRSTRSE